MVEVCGFHQSGHRVGEVVSCNYMAEECRVCLTSVDSWPMSDIFPPTPKSWAMVFLLYFAFKRRVHGYHRSRRRYNGRLCGGDT